MKTVRIPPIRCGISIQRFRARRLRETDIRRGTPPCPDIAIAGQTAARAGGRLRAAARCSNMAAGRARPAQTACPVARRRIVRPAAVAAR